MKDWRAKYADGRKGICDFGLNYDFYFKWLTNKVISCLIIRDAPETFNDAYIKTHLILDGNICITDFNDKLYGVIGGWGGEPDEYYVPTVYTIANPRLGSKMVKIGENGVVITNTAVDGLGVGLFSGGLYDLIHQTATLLADNIISINCEQINRRVQTFFTADSEAQAVAGEAVLKKMYAGSPYQILRQDIVKKLGINPSSNGTGSAQSITALVELHNYIISNFFQSIGIKANNVMKKERLITDEIESQDDFVQLSILEILTSWQRGFDKVNEMYGTDIKVELNPVLIREIADEFSVDSEPSSEAIESVSEPPVSDTIDDTNPSEMQSNDSENEAVDSEEKVEEETPQEIIEEAEEVVDTIVDIINDTVTEETEETEFTEVTEEEGEEDV